MEPGKKIVFQTGKDIKKKIKEEEEEKEQKEEEQRRGSDVPQATADITAGLEVFFFFADSVSFIHKQLF